MVESINNVHKILIKIWLLSFELLKTFILIVLLFKICIATYSERITNFCVNYLKQTHLRSSCSSLSIKKLEMTDSLYVIRWLQLYLLSFKLPILYIEVVTFTIILMKLANLGTRPRSSLSLQDSFSYLAW